MTDYEAVPDGSANDTTPTAPQQPSEEDLARYPNYYRLKKALREKYQTEDLWNPIYFDRHEEDHGYDQITFDVVERWKSSYMSGDEWRFTHLIRIWWKGFLIGASGWHSMDSAVRELGHLLNSHNEEVAFQYKTYEDRSERDSLIAFPDPRLYVEYCAQPGCSNFATHTFVKKDKWCVGPGNCGMKQEKRGVHAVRYCPKHSHRGDCDLEDADKNLELFEATCKREETHRYERVLDKVNPPKLTPDKFGCGQPPLPESFYDFNYGPEVERE